MDGRSIEAERFVLVDSQKRPRVVLEMLDDSSPRIGIFDEQGKLTARLGESNGKPLLQFHFDGKLRASLVVAPDGTTALVIGNEGPSVTVATMAPMQDEPTIILRSGSGAVRSFPPQTMPPNQRPNHALQRTGTAELRSAVYRPLSLVSLGD